MPQAVETATSYCSSMVARSPRRPITPQLASSPPFLEALRMAEATRERPVVDWTEARAISTRVKSSVFFLARVLSFSVSPCNSFSASPTRSRDADSSSSHFWSSVLFPDCLSSKDANSFSALASCSCARDTASSRRFTSICAVSNEFWKMVRSCCNGASCSVFSSSSMRSFSVISLVSSKMVSSLASSSVLCSAHSSICSSNVGMLSSASSMAVCASSVFFVSVDILPSSFLTVLFSCLMFSFI
mmetsp:Transcript_13647/g.28969  ORF Transcript_13647/g.28969 Transcript_13647/m.28969 type:complete len:244 (-) Transcript_13647:1203-1934(-)